MAKKGKKQSAADAAFIAKIATIGINTGGSKNKTCPDCGGDIEEGKQQVGYLVGEMHGQPVSGPVYTHKKGPQRGVTPAASDEQSFSA